MMSKICYFNLKLSNSRLNNRSKEQEIFTRKRLKIMDSSTPNNSWLYRNNEAIPDEQSPILADGSSVYLTPESQISDNGIQQDIVFKCI